MTSNPLTAERLAEIRARADAATANDHDGAETLSADDVPALLDEVERLRKQSMRSAELLSHCQDAWCRKWHEEYSLGASKRGAAVRLHGQCRDMASFAQNGHGRLDFPTELR